MGILFMTILYLWQSLYWFIDFFFTAYQPFAGLNNQAVAYFRTVIISLKTKKTLITILLYISLQNDKQSSDKI